MYRRGRREALPPPRSLLQGTSVDAGKCSTLPQQDGVSKEKHWMKGRKKEKGKGRKKKKITSMQDQDIQKRLESYQTSAKRLIMHWSFLPQKRQTTTKKKDSSHIARLRGVNKKLIKKLSIIRITAVRTASS